MKDNNFYIDEDCVVSFFLGEIGWMLQYFQGYMRYLKQQVYPDRKFVIMMNTQFHVFVHDFVSFTISLPDWFKELNLETDCYESPPLNSSPGSLTPPNVYSKLIEYFRTLYNPEKAIEVWCPRGCNFEVNLLPQVFCKYSTDKIESDKPIVSVFPRSRGRAGWRNVPEYVWKDLVDELKKDYLVVLGGTSFGAYLSDYEDENVVNLISYNEEDKTDKIVEYLCNSFFSISSQSGPTHMSLLCDIPSIVIGHEMQRHAKDLNRFDTPVSFRYVQDYRAIDVDTILNDIDNFLTALENSGRGKDVIESDKKTLNELIEVKNG